MSDYCIENDGARRAELAAIHADKVADKITEQAAEIARLRDVLKHYAITFCEGDCSVADEMDSPDCSGCIARAALNKEPKS